jgi:2-hydroxy-6-oxonona-2,4-dienedioate hydrolase
VHSATRSDEAPVLFVHGLGVSTTYFVPALRTFAAEYAVAALDLPGFGRSDDPRRPLGIVELARVVGEWAAAIGAERAPVVANSMGCQVALELAAERPGLVRALVLAGPTPDAAARTLARQFGRLVLDSLREPPRLTATVAFDYLFRAGPVRTLRTARLMLGHAPEEYAARVQAPTLVLRGERDPIASRRWVEELAARLPNGRVAVIAGAAHAAHYSRPAAVLAAARPLLRLPEPYAS